MITRNVIPIFFIAPLLLLFSCARESGTPLDLLEGVKKGAVEENLDAEDDLSVGLYDRPLYKLSPPEVDRYLGFLRKGEGDLVKRIETVARGYIGQPHSQKVIGDYPFEGTPDQPMVNLEESNCLSFVEQVFAMGLADGWKSFFVLLQRIRYRDGIIGWETRNHFFEADWQESNGWLIEDINAGLGKDLLEQYDFEVERDRYFALNGRKNPFPPKRVRLSYFPVESIPKVLPRLKPGTIFNMVRTNYTGKKWVGHMGFIEVDGGKIYMIHSRIPAVRRDLFMDYMNDQLGRNPKRIRENKPYVIGFRFFAIRRDPLDNLKKIDGPDYPRLVLRGKR